MCRWCFIGDAHGCVLCILCIQVTHPTCTIHMCFTCMHPPLLCYSCFLQYFHDIFHPCIHTFMCIIPMLSIWCIYTFCVLCDSHPGCSKSQRLGQEAMQGILCDQTPA